MGGREGLDAAESGRRSWPALASAVCPLGLAGGKGGRKPKRGWSESCCLPGLHFHWHACKTFRRD